MRPGKPGLCARASFLGASAACDSDTIRRVTPDLTSNPAPVPPPSTPSPGPAAANGRGKGSGGAHADGAPAHHQDGTAAPAPPAAPGPTAWTGRSFRDFLTDGSVAALCDQLARLVGVPVWIRDHSGEAIIPPSGAARPGSPASGSPWQIVPEAEGRRRAFEILGLSASAEAEFFEAPLKISTGVLGSIVCAFPLRSAMPSTQRSSLRVALTLLASSVCDVCEAQVSLRKRLHELDALYRLSSSLVEAKDADETLRLALSLAMDVMGADAGSIEVLDEQDESRLLVKAHRGLSAEWVRDTTPLSHEGEFRQAALRGEVVTVPDLLADPRVPDKARVKGEGLVSLLSAGLSRQAMGAGPDAGAMGVIRLFSKTPRRFSEEEGELLQAIAEHAAAALSAARLRRLRVQDEFIQRQVKLAASVQRRMLPKAPPSLPPFDLAAHYAPSLDLGGDFYDYMVLGGHLALMIGDVVGKGVPAALLMASVRASLRAHAQDVYDIEQILSRSNKALVRDTLDNEFATVWYGVADPVSLRLTYCGAGHDWPILVHVPKAGDRRVQESDLTRLTADGMALGIDAQQAYTKGMVDLAPGDCLVAFTDGVHDATNFESKRFGGTRLRRAILEVLANEPDAPAQRVVEHILWHIRQFSGLAGRADDLTLVVLRVKR